MFGLRVHNAKACQKNYKCFKCNGQHSNSICTFSPKNFSCRSGQEYFSEKSMTLNQLQRHFRNNFHKDNLSIRSLLLLSRNNVLLQTAELKCLLQVKDIPLIYVFCLIAELLLSFISRKAREALSLQTISKQVIVIKTFSMHVIQRS